MKHPKMQAIMDKAYEKFTDKMSLTSNYPFTRDFEAVVHEIMAWEEAAKKELNKLAQVP